MNMLNEFVPLSWDWIWRTTLQVSILICIIRLVQLAFRKKLSARWLYALWLLVIIRMVMPVGMETVWSVYNLFKVDEPEPATYYFLTPMTNPVASSLETVVIPPEPIEVLPWLWGAGVLALGFHLCRQWHRIRRQVKNGKLVSEEALLHIADSCRAELGLKRSYPIVESNEVSIPGLFGMFKPTLLTPESFTKTLSEEELRLIILHEWAHVKRWDVFVNGIMTILQVLHWFNPLVWYAFMRMRSDRELACDALVLNGLNEAESEQYGNTLLKLMAQHHGMRPIPGMVGVLENKTGLKRRIIAIASFSRRSYRWSLLAMVLLAIVGSFTLTQAKQDVAISEDDPETAAKVAAYEQTLKRPVGLIFEDIHLLDVFEFFEQNYKVKFLIDPATVAPKPEDDGTKTAGQFHSDGLIEYMNLKEITLAQALDAILRSLDLSYSVTKDGLRIMKRAIANPVGQDSANENNLAKIKIALDSKFTKSDKYKWHLTDFLDYLTDNNRDFNVILDNQVVAPSNKEDWTGPVESYVTDGMIDGLELNDVSIRDALNKLLPPLGLTFSTKPGYIWIFAAPRAVAETIPKSEETRTVTNIVSAEQMTFDFEDVTIELQSSAMTIVNATARASGTIISAGEINVEFSNGAPTSSSSEARNHAVSGSFLSFFDVPYSNGKSTMSRNGQELKDAFKKIETTLRSIANENGENEFSIDRLYVANLGSYISVRTTSEVHEKIVDFIAGLDREPVASTGRRIQPGSIEMAQVGGTRGSDSESTITWSYSIDEQTMERIRLVVSHETKSVSATNFESKDAKEKLEKWLSELANEDVRNFVVWNSFEFRNGDWRIKLTTTHELHASFSQLLARLGKQSVPIFESTPDFDNTKVGEAKLQIGNGLSRTLRPSPNVLDGFHRSRNADGLAFVEQKTTVNVQADFTDDVTTIIETDPVVVAQLEDTKEKPTTDTFEIENERIRETLKTEVSIRYEDAHISEIMNSLKEDHGIGYRLDERFVASHSNPSQNLNSRGEPFVTDGVVTYVNLTNVSLGQAINAVCRPLNLRYAVQDGLIWITSMKPVPSTSPVETNGIAPKESSPESRIDKTLSELVDLRFEDAYLEEFLEFVTDQFDINIVVDNRVVQSGKSKAKSVSNTPRAPTEISDGHLGKILMTNVSIRTALNVLLRRLNLTYSIQSSFVWITTADKLAHESFEHLETRQYDVTDRFTLNLRKSTPLVWAYDPSRNRSYARNGKGGSTQEVLEQMITHIREPVTGRNLSFIRLDEQKKAIVVHNTPTRLNGFESFLGGFVDWEDGMPPGNGEIYDEKKPLETRYYEPDLAFIEYLNVPDHQLERLRKRQPSVDLTREYWNKLFEMVPAVYDPESQKAMSFTFFNFETNQLIVHNTPANHVRIEEVLRQVAQRSSSGPDGSGITQSSKSRASDESTDAPVAPKTIEEILSEPVGVVFEDIHISDITDFIRDTYDINIILDKRVIAPVGYQEPKTKKIGNAYVTSGMVPYVNLKNVTLKEALKAILRPLNLDYSIESSFIWISTQKNIRQDTFEKLETRIYDVDDSWIEHISKDGGVIEGRVSFEGKFVSVFSLSEIGKARLNEIVPPIYEPQTGKHLSFFHVDFKQKHAVVHNSPKNLRAFEEYLAKWNDR